MWSLHRVWWTDGQVAAWLEDRKVPSLSLGQDKFVNKNVIKITTAAPKREQKNSQIISQFKLLQLAGCFTHFKPGGTRNAAGAIVWSLDKPAPSRSWLFLCFFFWRSASFHVNLQLVWSHLAEVIIVKLRSIHGRYNVTRVRIELRSSGQNCREHDDFTLLAQSKISSWLFTAIEAATDTNQVVVNATDMQ